MNVHLKIYDIINEIIITSLFFQKYQNKNIPIKKQYEIKFIYLIFVFFRKYNKLKKTQIWFSVSIDKVNDEIEKFLILISINHFRICKTLFNNLSYAEQ